MDVLNQQRRSGLSWQAGGTTDWNFFSTPYKFTITNTYWRTIEDLHNVAAMLEA